MNALIVLVALMQTPTPTPPPKMLMFTASWCPTCVQVKPEVQRMIDSGYRVAYIDVSDSANYNWMIQYNVQKLPTFIFFNDLGQEKSRCVGYYTAKQLADMYNKP